MKCIFCNSNGPFTTAEHIIPESLGNDDLLLEGHVCDTCQRYFGKEVEKHVLEKTPFAFWRTYLGIKTKKGKWPSVDLSQSKRQKGVLPAIHPMHDDGVGFTAHDDLSVSVDIEDLNVINEIRVGDRTEFRFVMTPKILHMLGRFLCKVGIELVCCHDPEVARSEGLALARKYARYGDFDGIWPLFHYSKGSPSDFRRMKKDDSGLREEVDCYSYSLVQYGDRYLLFRLSMGTDNWIVCLNDPYPHPVIREAFPGEKLQMIWYTKQEMG